MLAVAQFMVVLDATIVNVALPSIRTDLGFDATSLQWVVNAYTLLFGGFLLLGGRVGDLVGRRRVFLTGLGLFATASLAGGLASSEGLLIAARAVQGFGAALMSPAALALVVTTFPAGRERATAMGIWASLAGLGGTVGVVAGGVLVDAVGWEWVFFVNVPIAIAVVPFVLRLVRESREEVVGRRTYDVAGAVTATAGLMALVYAVIGTDQHGWTSGRTLGLFAASVALLATFVAIESRSKAPLVPLRLFANRGVSTGNVAQFLNGGAFIGMFFLLALALQSVLGMSAIETGMAFVPMGITAIAGATIAPIAVARLGTRSTFAIGAALGAVEVLRGEFRGSRFGMPLVVGSAALLLVGAVGVAGSIGGSTAATDLIFLRGVVIATTVYVICATVSLLFLANRRPGARDVLEAMDAFMPEPMMRAVVREKILRARARREQSWSFIDLRLDDATDLREATGDAAFGSTVRRFESIVAATFPSEADLCRAAPGHLTVFASQPAGAVREFVRAVLNEVSATHDEAPTSLRISASAGIATVDVTADSYESLVDAAASLAAEAQRDGGDRWRRTAADATAQER